MEQTAILVQNISKKFRLFNSPKERLLEALHPFNKRYHKEFWALKDISFEVKKGSTIGIVGKNGSGKSTLLQIICSILKPTSGMVKTDGKISALLALGAGFNFEFTGRQNVLLNGALLGLPGEDMKKRMPQIEAFADIGEFIDQPVKIYSTGMFLRLAFAAAINVEPDILVIDEVLAVGDAKFQHKCYQKFTELQNKGTTVILVTHDSNAVVRHCDYSILLEKGSIIDSGSPKDVMNHYNKLLFADTLDSQSDLFSNTQAAPKPVEKQSVDTHNDKLSKFLEDTSTADNCIRRKSYNKNELRFDNKKCSFIDYLVVCGRNYDPIMVNAGDTVDVYVKAVLYEDIGCLVFGFAVKTIDGITVYASNTDFMKIAVKPISKSTMVVFKLSVKLDLKGGDYFFTLGFAEKHDKSHSIINARQDVVHLVIKEKNFFDGIVELGTMCEEILRKNI